MVVHRRIFFRWRLGFGTSPGTASICAREKNALWPRCGIAFTAGLQLHDRSQVDTFTRYLPVEVREPRARGD